MGCLGAGCDGIRNHRNTPSILVRSISSIYTNYVFLQPPQLLCMFTFFRVGFFFFFNQCVVFPAHASDIMATETVYRLLCGDWTLWCCWGVLLTIEHEVRGTVPVPSISQELLQWKCALSYVSSVFLSSAPPKIGLGQQLSGMRNILTKGCSFHPSFYSFL